MTDAKKIDLLKSATEQLQNLKSTIEEKKQVIAKAKVDIQRARALINDLRNTLKRMKK